MEKKKRPLLSTNKLSALRVVLKWLLWLTAWLNRLRAGGVFQLYLGFADQMLRLIFRRVMGDHWDSHFKPLRWNLF